MGGTAANRVTSGGSGVAAATLGGTGGDQYMHQHGHSITDPGHTHTQNVGQEAGAGYTDQGDTTLQGTINTNSSTTGITVDNEGAGSSQNMPPVMAINKIIKT